MSGAAQSGGAPGRGGLLTVAGISKSFGGIDALTSVSLTVGAGEIVGLIGPNGAGKTTLFNCLTGITHPDTGTVTLDGTDLGHLPVYRRARLGMGRTFQRMELFTSMTVRQHLLVAARSRSGSGRLWKDILGMARPTPSESRRVGDVIELLGIGDIADLPAESVSLGHGRLVELGRALVGEPRLLLLDEPSSGLDATETAQLVGVLHQVHAANATSMLLVEHDLDTVSSLAERLYVLDFGKVIASGETAPVLADPRVRRAYLGVTADHDIAGPPDAGVTTDHVRTDEPT